MNRQNHSEPENRLTSEEQQEFLELLARLSPEQREALKEVLKSFTQQKCAGRHCCYPAHFYFLLCTFYSNAASTRIFNHTKAIFAPCAHFGLVRSTCRGQTHQHTTTIRTFYRNHCHEKLPPKIIQLSPSDSA